MFLVEDEEEYGDEFSKIEEGDDINE